MIDIYIHVYVYEKFYCSLPLGGGTGGFGCAGVTTSLDGSDLGAI